MKRVTIRIITCLFTLLFAGLTLTGCQQQEPKNTIKVGTIAGPETQLMEVAKKVAKKQYGLNVKIVPFTDYTMPNVALNNGSIDANMFQHVPYLNAAIKAHHFKIVPIGKVFVYPVGVYSKKIKNINNVPVGGIVAVPNDPSNESRALLLLEKAGLIKLKPGIGVNATILDIVSNPKKLKFKELDAADLPRALPDVSIAVINTNYAILAGLSPAKDALYKEGPDSPYANVVAVRTADRNNPQLHDLVNALHSPQVLEAAKKLFHNTAIPAWKVNLQN